MSRAPSWQAVADVLAERMSYHAHCAQHPTRKADPDNCPNCADRAAYLAWEKKSGRTFVAHADPGEVVDVFALHRQSRAGEPQ